MRPSEECPDRNTESIHGHAAGRANIFISIQWIVLYHPAVALIQLISISRDSKRTRCNYDARGSGMSGRAPFALRLLPDRGYGAMDRFDYPIGAMLLTLGPATSFPRKLESGLFKACGTHARAGVTSIRQYCPIGVAA